MDKQKKNIKGYFKKNQEGVNKIESQISEDIQNEIQYIIVGSSIIYTIFVIIRLAINTTLFFLFSKVTDLNKLVEKSQKIISEIYSLDTLQDLFLLSIPLTLYVIKMNSEVLRINLIERVLSSLLFTVLIIMFFIGFNWLINYIITDFGARSILLIIAFIIFYFLNVFIILATIWNIVSIIAGLIINKTNKSNLK